MKYEIIRKYRAYGGAQYAVLYFPEIGQQNEIRIDSEKEDLTEKAEALYASLSSPPKIEEQKPQASTSTKIIVDGKIIYNGAFSENIDISTALKLQFSVTARLAVR